MSRDPCSLRGKCTGGGAQIRVLTRVVGGAAVPSCGREGAADFSLQKRGRAGQRK